MNRVPLGLAALACIATAPAVSQSLQRSVAAAREPVPMQAGAGPQLRQAHPTQLPKIAADPGQRPQSANPIPSAGPAKQVPVEQPAAAAKQRAASVLDSTGKPVDGLIQVAPNRVFDPATGLYHWTRTQGQQQKLID